MNKTLMYALIGVGAVAAYMWWKNKKEKSAIEISQAPTSGGKVKSNQSAPSGMSGKFQGVNIADRIK